MATVHRPLMHSLLSLSGSHLIQYSNEASPNMRERMEYHLNMALTSLQTEMVSLQDPDAEVQNPTVAQVVVLCLKSICEGNTNGEYRMHLSAVSKIVSNQKTDLNEDFTSFLYEFFVYHDMSHSITSNYPSMLIADVFDLPSFVHLNRKSGAFIGVCDGLFGCISKIRKLRDRIRQRRAKGERPDVDFQTILDGRAIDEELNASKTDFEPNTPHWVCWQLYKTCAWLYLHRTINSSMANDQLRAGVDEAVLYLQNIQADDPVQSVLLTPIFIVGCSTFDAQQRPAILEAIDTLENYSHLGNIKPARQVIQEVWKLMDNGDASSWDWEAVMTKMVSTACLKLGAID
jgi:hypothetical protein